MKLYKAFILATCAAMAFTGCNNDDPGATAFDNKVYISAAEKNPTMLLKPSVPSYTQSLSAAIPRPMNKQVEITYETSESHVQNYSLIYGEEALMLPAANFEIAEPRASIVPGAVKSTEVIVDFKDLNLLDRNKVYVLPVVIASASNIAMLESGRTIYYVFRGAALVNVAADISKNRAWPIWKDAALVNNMPKLTLEALVYGNAFKNSISTLMGIEGQFLLRFGDNGVPLNQLQVATSGQNLTSSNLIVEPLRWYHIAVTFDAGEVKVYYDGVLKVTGDVGITKVSFGAPHSDESAGKPRCFWIGYSYDANRYLDGMISEVRIWNKVLTVEDINVADHFYNIDSASEGLVSYWKFDEGAGAAIKDSSQYGNDVTVETAPKWTPVSLPEIKK